MPVPTDRLIVAMGRLDPFREGFASGNATFQGTATGTHALALTFTDPGMAGAHPGLSNNSYLIETVLSVSTVHLHENVSDGFVLGGSIPGVMSLDHVQNILKERDVSLRVGASILTIGTNSSLITQFDVT